MYRITHTPIGMQTAFVHSNESHTPSVLCLGTGIFEHVCVERSATQECKTGFILSNTFLNLWVVLLCKAPSHEQFEDLVCGTF